METTLNAGQHNFNFVVRPKDSDRTGDSGGGGDARPTGERGMSLLVAIPCFNEAESIAGVIAGMPARVEGIDILTVLVVDDGSTGAFFR